MIDRTILDDLFAPIFPSIRVMFLRYRKQVLLARGYAELGKLEEVKKQHKETVKKLDSICKELRGA